MTSQSNEEIIQRIADAEARCDELPLVGGKAREKAAEDKFLAKVNKTDGCWIWSAGLNSCGYGKYFFNGTNQQAHRISWFIHNGEIPKGLHVLHKCDVRNCVNPAHLFLGTNKDNVIDKMKKGRARGLRG